MAKDTKRAAAIRELLQECYEYDRTDAWAVDKLKSFYMNPIRHTMYIATKSYAKELLPEYRKWLKRQPHMRKAFATTRKDVDVFIEEDKLSVKLTEQGLRYD